METCPILVAYATREGSTREVAQSIGQSLSEHGAKVEVRAIKDITDLTPYRAVILGSAIRVGKWLPEAVKFVEQHKGDLERKPLVYFLVCATLREDTPAHHREVLAYLDPVRKLVEPLETGLFAGKLDADHLPFLERMMVKVMHAPQGDWRDWTSIHAWADGVADRLEPKGEVV